ncbi:MAG: YopX family protein [Prevotella sp.]|nr:YopX family protein [Prevotella sp.]
MRTIKFRGKDIKTNEWVYGDLHTLCDNVHIHTEKTRYPYAGKRSFVVPETIGQFTGVYDKNGKEVYEGDIVDAWSAGHHSTCNVIKYVAPKFFISLINKETGEAYDFWHLSPNAFGKDELLEVIGNIHDNPDLLHKAIK